MLLPTPFSHVMPALVSHGQPALPDMVAARAKDPSNNNDADMISRGLPNINGAPLGGWEADIISRGLAPASRSDGFGLAKSLHTSSWSSIRSETEPPQCLHAEMPKMPPPMRLRPRQRKNASCSSFRSMRKDTSSSSFNTLNRDESWASFVGGSQLQTDDSCSSLGGPGRQHKIKARAIGFGAAWARFGSRVRKPGGVRKETVAQGAVRTFLRERGKDKADIPKIHKGEYDDGGDSGTGRFAHGIPHVAHAISAISAIDGALRKSHGPHRGSNIQVASQNDEEPIAAPSFAARKSRFFSANDSPEKHVIKDTRKSVTCATASSDAHGKQRLERSLTSKVTLSDRMKMLEKRRGDQLTKIKTDQKNEQKMSRFSEMEEKEREALMAAFKQYDVDNSGSLDHGEVIACLREFGLAGTTPQEKREILTICCEAMVSDSEADKIKVSTEDVSIDLLDFALNVVPRVRSSLADLRSHVLLKEFFTYDSDGSGKLSKDELKELARGMGLDPRMMELPANADDEVDFETFQDMMMRGREQLLRVCRDREREIQQAAELSEADFQEFREDLVSLRELFCRYDTDGSNSLDLSEVMFMLGESGLAPRSAAENDEIQHMIKLSDKNGDQEFNFVEFLHLVRMVRCFRQEKRREELVESFMKYDRDRSGSLSHNEVSLLLTDVGLQPTNKKEQEELANIISSVDADGSGFIDFQEFQELSQRIDEKLRSFRYEEQIEFAMCLGFTEKQMRPPLWL